MKKTLTAVAMCLSFTAGVYAQGQVDFRNRNTGLTPPLDSAVYSDMVGGTKLGDANFVAQIFFSATQTGSFTAITDPAAPFRTGTGAGYWNAGADPTRTLPGIAAGATAWIEVRVWDSTKGATYDAAKAAGGRYGDSNIFSLTTGGPTTPPSAPAALAGLQSFALVAIPEPSTIALGMLGAAALLLRRRK